MSTTVGLLVRLEAKPGREADVEGFLKSALPLVQAEPATTAWFAIRLGSCCRSCRLADMCSGRAR